ncbi:MAG: hypothetical protein J0I02_05515, partial [Alphaproteobacteria bacterium]|nr:hypothetical protein [Alphaproteobacteria bacterium]
RQPNPRSGQNLRFSGQICREAADYRNPLPPVNCLKTMFRHRFSRSKMRDWGLWIETTATIAQALREACCSVTFCH